MSSNDALKKTTDMIVQLASRPKDPLNQIIDLEQNPDPRTFVNSLPLGQQVRLYGQVGKVIEAPIRPDVASQDPALAQYYLEQMKINGPVKTIDFGVK